MRIRARACADAFAYAVAGRVHLGAAAAVVAKEVCDLLLVVRHLRLQARVLRELVRHARRAGIPPRAKTTLQMLPSAPWFPAVISTASRIQILHLLNSRHFEGLQSGHLHSESDIAKIRLIR
jgi:hypothetical protein